MSISKVVFAKADAPHAWCVRSGNAGGLKLTYSKFVMASMVTDEKKAFRGIAPTARVGYSAPLYGDKKSQGIEVQIVEWTVYNGVLYVSDGQKVYRLLLSKAHGQRMDTYDSVVRRLSQRTRRIYL